MVSTRSRGQKSDEDETERVRREKREGNKIAVEQRGEKGETGIKKPYGNQERLDILKMMNFLPMRFPHEDTMQELGILEEVLSIFEGMKLHNFMKLALPAYQDPTLHFLATLKVVKHPKLATKDIREDGPGFITFRMSIKKIEELYGFDMDRGLGDKMQIMEEELVELWETISSSKYHISKNKGGQIRNPAIRYAHKAIAHTIFARHECANVHKGELEMLDISLVDHLETLKNGTEMEGDNSCDTSLAMIMLNSFQQCMKNAIVSYEQRKIKDSYIGLGSMVTPILLASGFPLPQPSHQPQWIDVAYLNKTWFLRGKSQGKHVYRFVHPRFGISKVLLPNTELTSFKKRDNIVFLVEANDLFMDGGDATIAEEGEPSDEHPLGDRRYHFDPFDASSCSEAVKKAHTHIRLLQEWCKWQDKTIKKLVNSVKKLKKKVTRQSSSQTPQASRINQEEEGNSEETVSQCESRKKRRASQSPVLSLSSSSSMSL